MRILHVLGKELYLLEKDVALLYELKIVYDCGDGHDLHLDPECLMDTMFKTDQGVDICYTELLLMAAAAGADYMVKLNSR